MKKIVFIVLIVAIIAVVAAQFGPNTTADEIASPSPTTEPTATPSPTPLPFDASKLPDAIKTVLAEYPEVTTSVTFLDINSGALVDVEGDRPFTAASTSKLVTAGLFLNQVADGKATMSQKIGSWPADFQIEQLIKQSNTVSWGYFNTLLGYGPQQTFGRELGMTTFTSSNTENSMSTNDMAVLLQKLYKGEVVNEAHTKLMLSHMQNTNEESFIPPAVPKEMQLYHKTGFLDDIIHDGAIIDDGKNPFVLVVFTNGNDTYNIKRRAELFQAITKTVLESR